MKKINLKVYFKKRKQRLAVSGISPAFDWGIIVGFSTFLFFVGVGYAIYLYIQVNNGSLFEVVQDQTVQYEINHKKKQIEQKVQILEGRNFDETSSN
ncbi:MAG: hypothetical protein RLY49_474 [Candidatus Parcubacteria bacterium]|jgi:hypothetical protein